MLCVVTPFRHVIAPTSLGRRVSLQQGLFGFGMGTFLTGNAVYFTRIVGLSARQVGLGFTVAGVASLVLAVPVGKMADRFGAKRIWALSTLGGALAYLSWPLVGGMAAFLVTISGSKVAETAAMTSRGAYVLDLFTPGERVEALAFNRVAGNIGLTLGALFCGVALASADTTFIRAIPAVAALAMGANAAGVARLPQPEVTVGAPSRAWSPRGALRNHGYLALSTVTGVLFTWETILNVVIPLWLVSETDAPPVLLAWLLGTNTVLTVVLQVPAARGVGSVRSCVRACRRSGSLLVLSCAIISLTDGTAGAVTVVLLWCGHTSVTGAELFHSAGQWGFLAELSDQARRGEYQGAAQLGGAVGSVWAPAAYTFVTMEWHATGWMLISAVIVLATIAVAPAARSAERFLEQPSPIVT